MGNSLEKTKEKEGFFTKKDLIYWIIFLVFIIVLLLVWRWDSEQQLTNQISLVGSVSSILLALVAIGYAFFQTQRNSSENKMMLQTLMKINEEINKLESVNTSLGNIKTDLINIQEASSEFQEKMEVDIGKLRDSLEDKSWIDELDLEKGNGNEVDIKEKLKKEYEMHINENLKNAFRIDNEIMAGVLSHIGKISYGKKINEDEILKDLKEKGIKVSRYDIFNELQSLSERGIVSFLVDENTSNKKMFAVKSSEIKPVQLMK